MASKTTEAKLKIEELMSQKELVRKLIIQEITGNVKTKYFTGVASQR